MRIFAICFSNKIVDVKSVRQITRLESLKMTLGCETDNRDFHPTCGLR